ncbi:MAG: DUF1302 domain-containing protein, partial [Limnobacter sp.]|nr:DUF1302 domain-containing protein [Limnobacter sp.]
MPPAHPPAPFQSSHSVWLVALACTAVFSQPAHALQGQLGTFDYRFTSTLSVGTSIRVEGRDPKLYGLNNTDEGGTFGQGLAHTGDDGNLNFDTGDAFSTIFKGLHDFEISRDNYGFFGRVSWFYDQALNDGAVFHGHEPTSNARNQELQDAGFHPYARFDGVNVLDAYGYWNTELGEKPLNVRLGRQVINWGEGLLLFSSITGLNTVDVSALRRPAVDLKEVFTPAEFLSFNLGTTANSSLEGFYQLKWRKTVTEGCGTYFSSADFIGDGCDRLAYSGAAIAGLTGGAVRIGDGTQLGGNGFNVGSGNNIVTPTVGALTGIPISFPVVNRSIDRQPDDNGQFGLSYRLFDTGTDTEYGAYLMNYHSRVPVVSTRMGTAATPASGYLPGTQGGATDPGELVPPLPSSNPTLVPNANIVFGGTTANRTVRVTPVTTGSGTSTITVRVTDASGGSATDTFTVTVTPVNQPPTLNGLSNLTIN